MTGSASRRVLLLGTLLAGLPLLGLPAAAPARAQGTTAAAPATPPVRIRGTITAVTDKTLSVTTRADEKLEVALGDPLSVTSPKPVALADIKSGDYLGIVGEPGPDNTLRARAVVVFPEAMRGTGEGHYPWDLPGTSMTNATVSAVVSASQGRTLTMSYKGQEVKIEVPPDTPIVTPVPATRADLKPGAAVMLTATRDAAGHLSASRVNVAKDGVNPPN
ncbi:hypothetical protein [Roseomonas elaeocarpi]|uniref:DUF5666 domain-containing protein n=1 Tax=Roseomonas elaeocarpi TaxID=907779 RepID=A0ABV6JWS8_9PROT